MKRLNLPTRRLAWASDWHLNFLKPSARDAFIEQVAKTEADAFAITGDISDGSTLEEDLRRIGGRIARPVFVLLGNHDRYHSSFSVTEDAVQRAVAIHPNLYRLTGDELVELSPNTALLGVDGWADGTAGIGSATDVVLNDSYLIRDLTSLPKSLQWQKMRELAEGYSSAIAPALDEAMARYPNVIVLTHVPPLPEATWHEGRSSDATYLPHFCNPTLGRQLRGACARHPDTKLTVLCGHTHGEGVHREGSMTVFTAPAEYRAPRIDRVIAVE